MSPRKSEILINIFADGLGLSLGLFLTYLIRGWAVRDGHLFPNLEEMWLPTLVSLVGWGFLFGFSGMYRRWIAVSRSYHIYCLFRDFCAGGLLLLAMNTGPDLLKSLINGQSLMMQIGWIKTLGLYLLLAFTMTAVFRLLGQAFLRQGLRRGYGLENMIIVSEDHTGQKVYEKLCNTPEMGYKVVGFVGGTGSIHQKGAYLGSVDNLAALIEHYRVSAVLISHETASQDDIVRVLGNVLDTSVQVLVIPDLYDVISGHFKASFVHNLNFKELLPHNMPFWQAYLKRIMDIQIAILLLLLTSPLLLLTMLAIRLDSKGPIFYSQERIGQYGRPFAIWKFRTMRTDAESAGPQWATKKDPRITRIGRFLRKTRIDEIPQFFCVLKGDMSIVGPRPERQHFIDMLQKEIPLYARRLVMKPGITGWAQVRHTYDTSVEDVRKKLMYDLYYFENMSLFLDLQIMFRTVLVVLTGKGAQ